MPFSELHISLETSRRRIIIFNGKWRKVEFEEKKAVNIEDGLGERERVSERCVEEDEGMFHWHAPMLTRHQSLSHCVTLWHCRAELWPAWLHWNSWIPEPSGAATTSWDTLSFSSSITSVAGPAGTIWASAPPFICPGSTMPISSTEERHDAPLTSPSFQYIVDRGAICEVAYQRIGRIAGVVTGADEGTSCSLVVEATCLFVQQNTCKLAAESKDLKIVRSTCPVRHSSC